MTSSNFDLDVNMFSDLELFSDFDFSQLMTTEEQNILYDIMSNADFEQPADDSFNELDTPAQHLSGVNAPPPTPLEQGMALSQAGYFDGPESERDCVFCSAPFDTDHDPECPRVWKPSSGEHNATSKSVETKLTPIAESHTHDLTVLAPVATAAGGLSNSTLLTSTLPLMAPTPARQTAPPTYVSPYGPSPYPIPTSIPPSAGQNLPLRLTPPNPTTQHQAGIATADSSSDDEAPPQYQNTFADFDAARQALIATQDVDPLLKLGLTNDDWQQLKSHHIHSSTTRLFDALHTSPGPPPDNFTEDQEAYYYHHQGTVRQSVLNEVHNDPGKAEARAMLLLEQVINVHEHGVPTSVCKRTAIKSGYILETELVCSQRLQAVIHAVKNDKYVALDVLSGTGIADLARSPARYLRRKHENCRVNARKAFEKKKAEELKRNGTPTDHTPAAPASRAAKKTPTGKQLAQTQGASSSPRTPTPSVSTAQMSLDPSLELHHAQAVESAHSQLKRKVDFDTQETRKRFKYMEADQE